MDKGLLPSKVDVVTEPRLLDLALIPRYNTFIRVYNSPNCIVNNVSLRAMPTSTVHDHTFLLLTDWKGKVHVFAHSYLYFCSCWLPFWTYFYSFWPSTVFLCTTAVCQSTSKTSDLWLTLSRTWYTTTICVSS